MKVRILDVKSQASKVYNRCDHFVKYTLNGIYFEDFFTQYYDKNIGLKDIIKAYHINN